MTKNKLSRDLGSASAEFVILTPLLVAIIGIFFFAGRVVLAQQDVNDAARTALDAAVTANDSASATYLAGVTTLLVLRPDQQLCEQIDAVTDTANFAAGGTVTVDVSCVVGLPDLAFTGLPSSLMLSATRGATIEPYREVGP